ncbi:hypothetical protein GH733_016104 [Mirounga leonina]|nr:hypothetical protein GH733_016104 [Mirounga leonina]
MPYLKSPMKRARESQTFGAIPPLLDYFLWLQSVVMKQHFVEHELQHMREVPDQQLPQNVVEVDLRGSLHNTVREEHLHLLPSTAPRVQGIIEQSVIDSTEDQCVFKQNSQGVDIDVKRQHDPLGQEGMGLAVVPGEEREPHFHPCPSAAQPEGLQKTLPGLWIRTGKRVQKIHGSHLAQRESMNKMKKSVRSSNEEIFEHRLQTGMSEVIQTLTSPYLTPHLILDSPILQNFVLLLVKLLPRGAVHGLLGGSDGMDGGHGSLHDAKVVMDDLGQRSQAVGSAGGIADNLE